MDTFVLEFSRLSPLCVARYLLAMSIVLSHMSALRAIRHQRQTRSALTWKSIDAIEQAGAMKSCVPCASDIDEAHLATLGFWENDNEDELLDILLSKAANRRNIYRVREHVFSRPLPADALMRVERDVYVTSPAFTALLCSRGKTLGAVVMLLMELAGTYSLPAEATKHIEWGGIYPEPKSASPNPENEMQFEVDNSIPEAPVEQAHYKCEPATTISELTRMARWSKSSQDDTFRLAVKLVKDHSASPAESLCFAMFSLPLRHGGFGCGSIGKGFKLNHQINFNVMAQTMAQGMPYAIADAYLEEADADLEYNGIGHEETNYRIHDGQRNNGLKAMGITVFVINRDQMKDIAALEALAMLLHKRAGKRFQYRFKGYRLRQQALLNDLRQGIGLPPV